ncbi:hypothetical protein UNH65_05070 [Chitinophaga sp. 180180018-2]|nr:hypothetical protein [Chitinophaga sp. 212800010-3]
MIAVIVITAHSLVFHDHDHFASNSFSHHDEEDHENHKKHGLFALNLIDHCFTTDPVGHIDPPLTDLHYVVVPHLVSLPDIICYPVLKSSYQQLREFPPPRQQFSFSALRAPPISII